MKITQLPEHLKNRNPLFEPLVFKIRDKKDIKIKKQNKSVNNSKIPKNVLKGIENLQITPLQKREVRQDSQEVKSVKKFIKFLEKNASIASTIFKDEEVRLIYLDLSNFAGTEQYWLGLFQYLTLEDKKSEKTAVTVLARNQGLKELYLALPALQQTRLLKIITKKQGTFSPLYDLVCYKHFIKFSASISSEKHQSLLLKGLAENGCNDYPTLLLLAERYHVELLEYFNGMDKSLHNLFKILLYKCNAIKPLYDKVHGYQPKQIEKVDELKEMLKTLELDHLVFELDSF